MDQEKAPATHRSYFVDYLKSFINPRPVIMTCLGTYLFMIIWSVFVHSLLLGPGGARIYAIGCIIVALTLQCTYFAHCMAYDNSNDDKDRPA